MRDERRSSGDVGGENGIVFRTKPVQLRWMLGEEMEDVAHGAASSVVTREQKEFYLTGDEGFGGWIYDICCAVLRVFAGYFLQTSIQGKVNNRFVFSVVLAFVYLSHETILELLHDVSIHDSGIIPVHQRTYGMPSPPNIEFGAEGQPRYLSTASRDKGIIYPLRVESCVPVIQ